MMSLSVFKVDDILESFFESLVIACNNSSQGGDRTNRIGSKTYTLFFVVFDVSFLYYFLFSHLSKYLIVL